MGVPHLTNLDVECTVVFKGLTNPRNVGIYFLPRYVFWEPLMRLQPVPRRGSLHRSPRPIAGLGGKGVGRNEEKK